MTAGERLLSPIDIGVKPVHLWLIPYLAVLVYAWVAGHQSEGGAGRPLVGLDLSLAHWVEFDIPFRHLVAPICRMDSADGGGHRRKEPVDDGGVAN